MSSAAAGVIDVAVGDLRRGLERRLSTQLNAVADVRVEDEAARARADDLIMSELVGDADSRLKIRVSISISAGQVFEEVVVLTGGGNGKAADSGGRPAAARKNQTVVVLRARE